MLGANPANPAAPSRIKVGSRMSPDTAKEETNEELRDSFDGKERETCRDKGERAGEEDGGWVYAAGGREGEGENGGESMERAREVVW